MKKLLLILLFIVFVAQPIFGAGALDPSIDSKKTWKNAYRFTGKPKDLFLDWCVEVEERLDGTEGQNFIFCAPDDEPDQTDEGTIYYDSDTDGLYYRNASAWVTIAASTSSTLDEAYGAGSTMDVDGDAVTLDNDTGDDNALLILTQDDATNDPNALEITMGTGVTGSAIYITGATGGTDITASNFAVLQTGAVTCVGITNTGTVNHDSANVFFDATDTGKDLEWDDSQECLHFLDNCILGIGGATTAAPDFAIKHDATDVDVIPAATSAIWKWGDGTNDIDMWWYGSAAGDYFWWDESGSELLFVDAHIGLADDGTLTFGTNDDWVLFSDTDGILEITPDAIGNELRFGSSEADAIVMTWYSDKAGDTVVFDEENVMVEFEDVAIALGDATNILFGDTIGTGCFSMGEASNVLVINNVADGTGTVAFGAADTGLDVAFYGDAGSGVMLWDENANTNGALVFDNSDIEMGDGDFVQLGDGADLVISATGTTVTATMAAGSTFVFADTDNAASLFTFGTTVGNGLDVLFQGITSGDYVDWDAGADTWNFGVNATGVDVYFYGDTASAYALWDESANRLVVAGGGQISLNDAVELLIGTGTANAGDFEIFSTNGATLTIDTVTAETGSVEFGVTNLGIDVQLWAATDAEGVLWDASDEALEFTGANLVMDAASTITATGIVQIDQVVTDAAAYDVTAANSGKIHIIGDLTQNTSIDLPAEADGLNYEFWYVSKAAGGVETHDHTIDTEDDGQFFYGGVVHLDTSDDSVLAVYSDNGSNSKLTLSNMDAGTRVKVTCDGSNWYVTGTVVSDTAPAFADQ